ncbi:MAG: helix-hairpin-helix domain-containing protein [Candidatus Aminicenantes bacterium]|nr:helix-hairpin-helix domain-containing protein [Candidatus Aminicenantes bacterium]
MKDFVMKGVVFGLVCAVMLTAMLTLRAPAQSKAAEKKIDINTATSAELQKLPRIGEKVAQRIIDYREQHGEFKKIEEIMKVKGIGEKVFKQIKDLIEAKPKTPNK